MTGNGQSGMVAEAYSKAAVASDMADVIDRSERAHGALMRGDLEAYCALIRYTDDFTLMSPFGGKVTHGADMTPERTEAMGQFFRNGIFRQEVVQAYGSPDMIVLAVIERQWVEVGGTPGQDWPLRVTLVFQRVGGEWRLAHRHADALVEGISLELLSKLALGKAE